MNKVYATGKRKTAIAKVYLETGTGKLVINGIGLDEWLGGHDSIKMKVMQPLVLTNQDKSVDIHATTLGGGYSAQAEALRSGIAKALNNLDREAFRKTLKSAGLLTRDARIVERKKYGKRKARRSPQFSKR
ncbi:30S ribosomal protein S9 [Helicobacter muridarum]|uniref:Small ribosomal subunit protein uS9 n=1 Tax=Helicobacter muridarum TaxID=216 RepID=A0A099TZL6_9HELI|nr:30S ribosomal protein S9 [Helicobacter muridarum]TLD99571.1 30S ribosomal protein S9 [Helicobacter muridarum]STQ85913.1 30S ribosomal protein S9 [Helicobacter muridarum]